MTLLANCVTGLKNAGILEQENLRGKRQDAGFPDVLQMQDI